MKKNVVFGLLIAVSLMFIGCKPAMNTEAPKDIDVVSRGFAGDFTKLRPSFKDKANYTVKVFAAKEYKDLFKNSHAFSPTSVTDLGFEKVATALGCDENFIDVNEFYIGFQLVNDRDASIADSEAYKVQYNMLKVTRAAVAGRVLTITLDPSEKPGKSLKLVKIEAATTGKMEEVWKGDIQVSGASATINNVDKYIPKYVTVNALTGDNPQKNIRIRCTFKDAENDTVEFTSNVVALS